jgi:hypothetical protein
LPCTMPVFFSATHMTSRPPGTPFLCAFTITVTITLNVTSRERLSGLSQNWITENYINICPQTIISTYSGQF